MQNLVPAVLPMAKLTYSHNLKTRSCTTDEATYVSLNIRSLKIRVKLWRFSYLISTNRSKGYQ